MSLDGWAYVSGMCAAREALFLPARAIEELGALEPREVSARLSRSFFGQAEPLSAFDRFAAARRRRELDEIARASPASAPADIVRAGFAADEIRKGLPGLPDHSDSRELVQALAGLALRAGELASAFSRWLAPPLPEPGPSARLAGALLVDSAELLVTLELADASGDAVVALWADSRARAVSSRVARRALTLGLPREALAFFFRGRLLTARAREFMSDWNERSASAIAGDIPEDTEAARLREIAAGSRGEPFSPARALHYLLEFCEQERLIRRAVYRSLGWSAGGWRGREGLAT